MRVVFDDTGAPAVGALVLDLDGWFDLPPQAWDAWREGLPYEDFARRFGRAFKTDVHGEVRVPWILPERTLIARMERDGRLWQARAKNRGPCTLRVRVPGELAVTVLKADGTAAANCPVTLGLGSRTSSWLSTGQTGPAGEPARIASDVLNPGKRAQGKCRVEVPGVFARDVTLEVPREGTAACTLHLPPTGSVRVAPTTDRGNPVTAGRFALAREGENFDLHIDNSGLRQPCQRIQAGDPLPTWDWVEVGMPLELRWWDENDRLLSNTPISGPSAAGESLEVVLEEYGASRTATARILDEKGRPAAHRILWMGISEDWLHGLAAQWTRILTVQTDAAGRLSVPLDPIGDLVSGQRLWPQWVFSDPPSGGAEHFVLTPRLARGGPEVLDLGDLTLQPMPLLVSGRVVDADGAPVECWVAARPGGHEGEFPEPDLNFKEQGFEANRSWSARSGPDGRYEIHGWFHSGAVELSTDAPAATVVDGHLAPRGATEHQIRLASCGAVQVDLRTMPGNPSEYVRMTLQVSQGRWLHARWTDKHTAFFAEVEHGVPLELKLDAAGGDPWDFWHGVVEVSAATTTFVSIPAIPMEVQHVLIPLHESGEPRFRINECQRSGIPCKALRSPGPGIPEYQEILILNPPGQTVDAVHVSRLPYVTSADEQTLVIPVGPGETRLDP